MIPFDRYRNHWRVRKSLHPVDPYVEGFKDFTKNFRTEADLLAYNWMHLPAYIAEHYKARYRRWKQGVFPAMDERRIHQFAEALAEQWDLFGPIIENLLKQTKAAHKAAQS